jgi:hypothetical protein
LEKDSTPRWLDAKYPSPGLNRWGAVMAIHRIFKFDPDDGNGIGAPIVLECDADASAIEKAKEHVDRALVELWQGDRLVCRLQPRKS